MYLCVLFEIEIRQLIIIYIANNFIRPVLFVCVCVRAHFIFYQLY